MNHWTAGDRYKTDDGTLMGLESVEHPGITVEGRIEAPAEGGGSHSFDLNGYSLCVGCSHGHLAQRITGTIFDTGGKV